MAITANNKMMMIIIIIIIVVIVVVDDDDDDVIGKWKQKDSVLKGKIKVMTFCKSYR